ncbi:PH domain-containing protein [Georgenia sp. AZ-5]|uniref:PH domain-containing protein n=1 Tax=Georgenia sp. AZ-5 TaxID=3367526 RepID=UPI0037547A5A
MSVSPPVLPPAEAVAGPGWRRVHKVTPVLNAWKAVVAVLAFLAWQVSDQVTNVPGDLWETVAEYRARAVLAVVGAVVLVALVAAVYSMLAWRRMRFAVGRESVDLHTGILFRQERHARLSRVQAVDVVQPLLGRLFGLAQVRVETAGGGESNVVIGYLREPEAQELRNEIMARARYETVPEAAGPDAGPAAAPEVEMGQVPAGRLVVSLLLSGSMISFLLVLAGLVAAAVVTRSIGPFAGALPAFIGWGGYLWGRFAGEFGFRLAISPDGIRLRHGLLETRAQTLPPGRVQAVSLTQSLLWRRNGWWRVQVNVAGYGAETPGRQAPVETVLLPVGGRGEALTALWLVLPDLGAEDAEALLDAALEGSGGDAGFLPSPRRARWLDPVTWRRNAVRITGTALLMRTGRLSRSLVVVPHGRTQSLALKQGPLERRLGLADLFAHSVPGPVTPVLAHLDADLAGTLLMRQAERARSARSLEAPEDWRRRVGVPGGGPATTA